MKRSPGPTPCSPLTTISAASESRELALDAPLHALGERVARALHAGQVDEHQLAVVAVGGDAADRAAGRLRLVGDDRDLGADDRVDERRLADVRPAGERDEAAARQRSGASSAAARAAARASRRRRSRGPCRRGAARRARPPRAGPRCARADHDVAELARRRRRSRRRRSGTTARRSARPCRGARAFSSRMRVASTNSIATWPSSTPRRASGERAQLARPRRAGDRRRAQRPARRPRPRASPSGAASAGPEPGRCALGVHVVGLDDPLHELVPDDVLAAEADELDPLDRVEHVGDHDQARTAGRAAGRPA